MTDRIEILGVPFDRVDTEGAVRQITDAAVRRSDAPFVVVTPNPLMVMNAREDALLMDALRSASLSLPDGIGVVRAAQRLGTPLCGRVTGVDTGYLVAGRLAERGGSVYLLGATDKNVGLAARKLEDEHKGLRVVGTHHGYFEDGGDEERRILEDIRECRPDLLVVCLGSPRQERWVRGNIGKLCGVGAVICLGGAVDVWSGRVRRAPRVFCRLSVEWLWRMICQPHRLCGLPRMVKFTFLTRKRG